MARRPRIERARTLRHAAATLFSLLALLPLLIFVWTLHRVDALDRYEAQVGVGLSLGVAVLGFIVLRRLLGQISGLMQALSATAVRAAQVSVAAIPEPANAPAPAAARDGAASLRRVAAPAAPFAPSTPAATRGHPPGGATGLGTIRELEDMTAAVSALWRREAESQVGRPVRVDVINSTTPVLGTLVQVTEDGLLLERDGARIGVVWRRIAAVEADRLAPTSLRHS
jgi:hypothetical protein